MVQILKKDGIRVEDFDPDKICRAVNMASDRAGVRIEPKDLEVITQRVFSRVNSYTVIPVQEIHPIVIEEIQQFSEQVANCYKEYRGYKQNFNKTFSKIIDATRDLLSNGDKENANKNSDIVSTIKELTSGIVSKHIALDYELPKEASLAHKEGYIHIHDLTDELFKSINCCLFSMDDVLKNGYRINGVTNRQPNHLETALSTISDIILSASSQQYGGFTVPQIDTVLAPYVKIGIEEYKEEFKHTRSVFASEELYVQWVEDFVYRKLLKHSFENMFDHRLNTINNSNGQTSFTTITFGLDTSKEGRLVSTAILESRIEGIGKNKISAIFPKLVFLHRNEINGLPESPNYDLKQFAIECSMKRMYPDWLSLDSGYLADMYNQYGKVVDPMGCRAFLSPYFNEEGEVIFKGRANCGAVSLNLPRYALQSNGDLDEFYKLLDKYLNIAIKKHIYKYNKLRGVKASSNPLFFCEGGCHIQLKPTDTIEKAIKTFTWSIGYIGIDEVTRYFTNKGVSENNKLGIEILNHIKNKIDIATKETGLLFALYSTPSESLCYRFLLKDRDKFGVVKGVTDKDYYTNSYHVNVRDKISALDKQDAEKPMFDIATGGRIVYNEFPHTHNKKAMQQCIDYAMSLGLYYGVNLQLDTCLDCDNSGEFKDKVCSKCGSDHIVSINRVCGYLGYSVVDKNTRFNKGKLAEVKDRCDHFSE